MGVDKYPNNRSAKYFQKHLYHVGSRVFVFLSIDVLRTGGQVWVRVSKYNYCIRHCLPDLLFIKTALRMQEIALEIEAIVTV